VSDKTQNPFDFSEFFTPIDPKSLLDQWQQVFSNTPMPHVDTSALFQAQSKNLYALIAANQAVMAGARNLLQRQSELMKEAMDEASEAMQNMGKISDSNEAAVKQTELVQAAFEKALSNTKEISDMITRNYQEAADEINQRFSESLEEIKNAVTESK
jgi:phasin family protein